MSDNASSIAELRNQLCFDPVKAKVKFCVKLWRLLRYSLEHEAAECQMGIRWCSDGMHFICNSQVLGNFLNLKSNSINTNMRAHGFSIDSVTTNGLCGEFGLLPDLRNWKLRHNASFPWNTRTTEDEAGCIPAKEAPARLEIVQVSNVIPRMGELPAVTVELISGQEDLVRDIQSLMAKVAGSDTWKMAFLAKVTSEWLTISQSIHPVPQSILVRSAIDSAEPFPPISFSPLIEANLHHILMSQSNSSQMSEGVCFVEFLKLVLRFGLLERMAYSVYEVSDPNFGSGQQLISSQFYFMQFSQQSQHDVDPCFANWFVPSTDQNEAASKLSNGVSWVIRFASSPNMFTIQLKSGKSTIATHIKFDPMPQRHEDRYAVEFDGGVEIKRGSWRELIEQVLNLEVPIVSATPMNHEALEFVPANIVASSAGPLPLMSSERNQFDHPFGQSLDLDSQGPVL